MDRVKTRIANQAPLKRNWTSTVCIPYVPRTLNSEGIRVAFTSTSTLAKLLTHVKDSIPKDKESKWFTNSNARTVQQYTSVRPLDQLPTE